MTEIRYDVAYYENHVSIEAHHCRSWEPDETGELVGCYGTNPRHGFTLDEACEIAAEWHEAQARLWRSKEHHEVLWWLQPVEPVEPPA